MTTLAGDIVKRKGKGDKGFGMPMYLLLKGTVGILSAREGPQSTNSLLNSSAILLGSVILLSPFSKVSGGDSFLSKPFIFSKCLYYNYRNQGNFLY